MNDNTAKILPEEPRRLRRSSTDRMLAGVSAAAADWLGLDVTMVRIAFVVLGLVGGVGVPLYLAAWLLVPEEGAEHSVAEDLLKRTGWA